MPSSRCLEVTVLNSNVAWRKGPSTTGPVGLHSDLQTNISTAELFIKNIARSLKQGMSVTIQGQECLMIAFRPPTEWPQGVTALPIAFNQDKAEFGRVLEVGINRTMEIADRCFQDIRRKKELQQERRM